MNPAPASHAPFSVPDLTVPDLLDNAVARVGGTVALDFLGATTTYRELADQVDRAATVLRDAGVRAGDRVALVLPNCPQHVVAFYAALRLGAIVAEHNPLAAPAELQAQLDTWTSTYNQQRPHSSLRRRPPAVVYNLLPKATPRGSGAGAHHRVRHDRVDQSGVISLRRAGRMHHIGLSRTRARTRSIKSCNRRDSSSTGRCSTPTTASTCTPPRCAGPTSPMFART